MSNINPEAAILACILASSDALDDACEVLKPEHFHSPFYKSVFEATLDLRAKGQPVDSIIVGSRFALSGPDELAFDELLREVPNQSSRLAYIRLVYESWMLRRLKTIGSEMASVDDKVTVTEAVDRAASQILDLSTGQNECEPIRLGDPFLAAMVEIEAASKNGGIVGLSSGLADLDRALGGLAEGELLIVGGRPGSGKSALAFGIATTLSLAGVGCIAFSLEMPTKLVATRTACSISRVELSRAKTGRLNYDEMQRFTAAGKKLATLPFLVDEQPGIGLSEMRSKLRKAQRQMTAAGTPIRLVVVDYLQLMGTRVDAGSRDNELGEVSRGLKAMAKEFRVPVLALSQLNRKCEDRPDKRPMMSDLRESGSIEADADAIILIYRDEYYNAATKQKGVAELIVGKSRNGATGRIHVAFDGALTTFRDLTKDERLKAGLTAS